MQLGEHVTLLFEDELTIRYQIQEMLRIEKIFEEDGIQDELDAYNPLVPDGTQLEGDDADRVPGRRRAPARAGAAERHRGPRLGAGRGLRRGSTPIADEDLERENDEKTSAVHFLRFELTPEMVAALKYGVGLRSASTIPTTPRRSPRSAPIPRRTGRRPRLRRPRNPAARGAAGRIRGGAGRFPSAGRCGRPPQPEHAVGRRFSAQRRRHRQRVGDEAGGHRRAARRLVALVRLGDQRRSPRSPRTAARRSPAPPRRRRRGAGTRRTRSTRCGPRGRDLAVAWTIRWARPHPRSNAIQFSQISSVRPLPRRQPAKRSRSSPASAGIGRSTYRYSDGSANAAKQISACAGAAARDRVAASRSAPRGCGSVQSRKFLVLQRVVGDGLLDQRDRRLQVVLLAAGTRTVSPWIEPGPLSCCP